MADELTMLIRPAIKHKSYAVGGPLAADVDVVADGGISRPSRTLRVGVSGDVRVMLVGGTTDTYYGVVVGESIDAQVSALIASGTTAQKITLGW